MMQGDYPLLYVQTRAGFFGAADQYPDFPGIHFPEQFRFLLIAPIVDKSDFAARNVKIRYQFT